MSYAMSGALQSAIYDALINNAAVAALVGPHVYDAVPSGLVPETYVSLGHEQVRDASDQTGDGALHDIEILVTTRQPGFAGAKAVAAAISDALRDADLALSRGRLVFLRFLRADARRIDDNTGREVRMRFRARVDDE
ncbi:DUF3168 domain-containing protein [Roseobacter sinensis]|uniref:DUF3168 domain-containing protein n=1 Tax=Roseobacter sinensis TaxID=2931391 RepID=A0ABT3BC43_9RHOB|nr:DUF3168 domain-containing protein [Roseobacter sp. WL0113]MCV3271135.1 DUF3168 domain-containing protein [Roseobacter sp. WL0113]